MNESTPNDIYKAVGTLEIYNTLFVYLDQFVSRRSIEIVRRFDSTLRTHNIQVFDMKKMGLLDWLYICPVLFDQDGLMFVGPTDVVQYLLALEQQGLPSSHVQQQQQGSSTSHVHQQQQGGSSLHAIQHTPQGQVSQPSLHGLAAAMLPANAKPVGTEAPVTISVSQGEHQQQQQSSSTIDLDGDDMVVESSNSRIIPIKVERKNNSDLMEKANELMAKRRQKDARFKK